MCSEACELLYLDSTPLLMSYDSRLTGQMAFVDLDFRLVFLYHKPLLGKYAHTPPSLSTWIYA